MHSGQNIAKIFTCVRYLRGLEKLPEAVLWNVGRSSNVNEEPMCLFIGNSMVWFVDYWITSKSAIVYAFRTKYRLNIYLCLIFDRV